MGAAGGLWEEGNRAWLAGRMQGGGTRSRALLLLLEMSATGLVAISGNGQTPPGK